MEEFSNPKDVFFGISKNYNGGVIVVVSCESYGFGIIPDWDILASNLYDKMVDLDFSNESESVWEKEDISVEDALDLLENEIGFVYATELDEIAEEFAENWYGEYDEDEDYDDEDED